MNEINMVDACRNIEEPTVDDAIRWYQEEAWRHGVLGFGRDVGDLKDIFQDWNAECPPVSHFQATAGNPLDLSNIPQRLVASAASAEARHQERMRIIDGDFFLKEDVRLAVHRRLIEAGMHPQEIDLNTQKMESMTFMTAYLWDIEHRTPNFDFQMKALVFTNFRGTKLPTLTVLSTKAPFPELLASLKEFVIGKAEMTGRPIAAGEDIEFLDAWLYRMTDCKNGKPIFLDRDWHRLSYDHHYQTMLKRFSGQGQGSMMPLFVPVCCLHVYIVLPL